jgi:N-acetylglucosaminyldiphosphoundecaprenol N-acetyl-beta-D-mannosaminyltransferase
MGSPRKEEFLINHRGALRVMFAMGVGGAFDVWAGGVRRAPHWMQSSGLEWLYRVGQEPRRLGARYLRDATDCALVIASWWVRCMLGRANDHRT